MRIVTCYFAAVGLALHIGVILAVFLAPELVEKASHHMRVFLDGGDQPAPVLPGVVGLTEEIAQTLAPWEALASTGTAGPGEIRVAGRLYASLKEAAANLQDNETLVLGEGIYSEPLLIRANDVTIVGDGHAILEGVAHRGKAAIVARGDNVAIANLECRGVKVADRNGACVRFQGKNLTLSHVYFHDSEQGVLATRNSGVVQVLDSRFERLGAAGRAHGIYAGGEKLYILRSGFIAMHEGSHAIKSRARETVIDSSLITSLSARTGRLLDLSNGGVLHLRNSVLAQGPNVDNSDIIGFGLEGDLHETAGVNISGNLILLERLGASRLMRSGTGAPTPVIRGNVIIGGQHLDAGEGNYIFASRQEAGLPPYPRVPAVEQVPGGLPLPAQQATEVRGHPMPDE